MNIPLNINNNLPLLISDADEVIFEFMESFEEYLLLNNMYFSYQSFKLNGNIYNKKNEKPIDSSNIPIIISNFFQEYAIKMPVIKGAKSALKELSKVMNIVILSNIPKEYTAHRIQCLKNNNMNYTFIANEGPKAARCSELQKLTNKKVFFIDDLPNQISSVSKDCNNITTIHFLQNKKLLKVIPAVNNCNFQTNNWKSVLKFINNNI
ncbi:hypothetical protein OAE09_04840 [Alphaproteobacteria bacterium]|nr:hypothetical protein [Alphaproteobacteria bacterium]